MSGIVLLDGNVFFIVVKYNSYLLTLIINSSKNYNRTRHIKAERVPTSC